MADADLTRDIIQAAEVVAALAGDEDRFRATFDAFLAADRESYQRLLTELQLLDRCESVCDWICSKHCVLVCLELCGPPAEAELPDLREFAEVVTRITGDEELVERLAATVADRDADGFRALVTELKIERFCHLLCHWACSVRCRLLCEVACSPTPTHIPSFVAELAQAGAAISTLTADPAALADVTKAVLAGDCDLVRVVFVRLGLFERCHLVCEWLCTWRCVRVCLLLCRRFPIEPIKDPLGEAFAFAQAIGRLVADPTGLRGWATRLPGATRRPSRPRSRSCGWAGSAFSSATGCAGSSAIGSASVFARRGRWPTSSRSASTSTPRSTLRVGPHPRSTARSAAPG